MFLPLVFVSSFLTFITDESIFRRWHSITSKIEEAKKRLPFYMEIYRNTSWKTLAEFLSFKVRTYVSVHLETGLLVKPKSPFYDLVYYDGVVKYTVRFPKVRGPSRISQILDEHDDDITERVKGYMGPSHNFHGIPTTPSLLGYSSVRIILIDGTDLKFNSNDLIIM